MRPDTGACRIQHPKFAGFKRPAPFRPDAAARSTRVRGQNERLREGSASLRRRRAEPHLHRVGGRGHRSKSCRYLEFRLAIKQPTSGRDAIHMLRRITVDSGSRMMRSD
jgi:hypothetical protein